MQIHPLRWIPNFHRTEPQRIILIVLCAHPPRPSILANLSQFLRKCFLALLLSPLVAEHHQFRDGLRDELAGRVLENELLDVGRGGVDLLKRSRRGGSKIVLSM